MIYSRKWSACPLCHLSFTRKQQQLPSAAHCTAWNKGPGSARSSCSPSFSHAWARLDDVWAQLKPDDARWATAVVQPLQQLWGTENGCDRSTHSAEIQAIPMFFADPWVVVKGLAYGTYVPLRKLQTDRLKTPLEVGAMNCGNKSWLLLESFESHTLMRCISQPTGQSPSSGLHRCVDKL